MYKSVGFLAVAFCCFFVSTSLPVKGCNKSPISPSLTLVANVTVSSADNIEFLGAIQKLYYKSNITLSWFDAWKFCRQNGFLLASVETAEQQNALSTALAKDPVQDFWLSGTNLGHLDYYIWMSSGNKVNYTNWVTGQPDNLYQKQNCLRIWGAYGANKQQWDDYGCEIAQNFICESVETTHCPPVLPPRPDDDHDDHFTFEVIYNIFTSNGDKLLL